VLPPAPANSMPGVATLNLLISAAGQELGDALPILPRQQPIHSPHQTPRLHGRSLGAPRVGPGVFAILPYRLLVESRRATRSEPCASITLGALAEESAAMRTVSEFRAAAPYSPPPAHVPIFVSRGGA